MGVPFKNNDAPQQQPPPDVPTLPRIRSLRPCLTAILPTNPMSSEMPVCLALAVHTGKPALKLLLGSSSFLEPVPLSEHQQLKGLLDKSGLDGGIERGVTGQRRPVVYFQQERPGMEQVRYYNTTTPSTSACTDTATSPSNATPIHLILLPLPTQLLLLLPNQLLFCDRPLK